MYGDPQGGVGEVSGNSLRSRTCRETLRKLRDWSWEPPGSSGTSRGTRVEFRDGFGEPREGPG